MLGRRGPVGDQATRSCPPPLLPLGASRLLTCSSLGFAAVFTRQETSVLLDPANTSPQMHVHYGRALARSLMGGGVGRSMALAVPNHECILVGFMRLCGCVCLRVGGWVWFVSAEGNPHSWPLPAQAAPVPPGTAFHGQADVRSDRMRVVSVHLLVF